SGCACQAGNGTSPSTSTYDFSTVLENTRITMPYTMAPPIMPTTKMRRKNGGSTFMCMYQPATRKNFAAPIANRAMMIRFVWAVSMYETAISIAVSTTSTTAISTYCRGDGWCPYSETSM